MFNNDNESSSGERVMLPAFYINTRGPATTISSLEDADKFASERIGTDGTFDCYLGEEITINDGTYNAIWQVVGADTELGKGDTPLTKHHISLVPKTFIDISTIHSSITNCNGYANSDIHNKTIPSIVSSLETVLGNHLLERRVKLTNVSEARSAMASANGYYSVKANLMCQQQVFGTMDSSYGNAYDTGDDTEQLPGFKTGEVDKDISTWWWLRDVYGYVSSTSYHAFSVVNTTVVITGGALDFDYVSHDNGVRPLITIG